MQKRLPGHSASCRCRQNTARASTVTGRSWNRTASFGRKILDIDYDIYAEGEAELGWLNASVLRRGEAVRELDKLLRRQSSVNCEDSFHRSSASEVAHLKAIGLQDLSFGVANLVSTGSQVELSLPSNQNVTSADVIVNARAAGDPAELEKQVRTTVAEVCKTHGCKSEVRTMQSFRPGRPMPTHRYAMAK